MSKIIPYSEEWFPSLLRLLSGFDDPKMTAPVWQSLLTHEWDENDKPKGWLIVDGEHIGGFVGCIFTERRINNELHSFCNVTSWIVEEEYRNQSLGLLFKILSDKQTTFVDLTASPEAKEILIRLGFKELETKAGLFIGDESGETAANVILGFEETKKFLPNKNLTKLLDDHRGTYAHPVLISKGSEYCLCFFTKNTLTLPQIAFSKHEQELLSEQLIQGNRIEVAHLHFCSNPALFNQCLNQATRALRKTFAIDGLLTEGRMFSGNRSERIHWCKLPLTRLFRSPTLTACEIDSLYSELVLMGVSGQGHIEDEIVNAEQDFTNDLVKKEQECAAQVARIDQTTEEIRALELRIQTRDMVRKAACSAAAPSSTRGIAALHDQLHNFDGFESQKPKGAILMFHSVLPEAEKSSIDINKDLEISPEFLDQSISHYINKGWDILSLDEAQKRLNDNTNDTPFLVITFDDGYRDNLIHAYPVLKKHNAPFTIYICTDYPNLKTALWWYLLEDLVKNKDEVRVTSNGSELIFPLRSPAEKESAFYSLREIFISAHGAEKESLFEQLFAGNGIDVKQHTKERVLSWDEIRQLNEDPLCTIGCHTVSHPSMAELPEEELTREISESRTILEQELGESVKHFCYPYGSPSNCDTREFRAVEKAGFQTATTTTMEDLNHESIKDFFALPRIPVRGRYEDLALLELLIEGMKAGHLFILEDYLRNINSRLEALESLGLADVVNR